MDKILVVFTGGTISCKSGPVMSADEEGGYDLIKAYRGRTGDKTEFEYASALTILSEDHTLSTMETLCRCLWETDLSKYSGVIITHGSDTLSYVSSLIALIFTGAGLPIVLTAAGKPIDDPESNGVENFAASVQLVKSGLCGVYAVYSGRRSTEIFAGDRIIEADGYFEEFSHFGEPFGEVKNGVVRILNGNASKRSLVSPFEFKKKVLIIKAYPGIDYNVYDVTRAAAVLHIMYHSGTACTAGEDSSFLLFAEKCRANGCLLYVLPFKGAGADMYSSAAKIKQSGVIPLPLMSAERAYALLLIRVNGGQFVSVK